MTVKENTSICTLHSSNSDYTESNKWMIMIYNGRLKMYKNTRGERGNKNTVT
jgi:hypothetical protein